MGITIVFPVFQFDYHYLLLVVLTIEISHFVLSILAFNIKKQRNAKRVKNKS